MSSNQQEQALFEKLADEGLVGADRLLNEDEILTEEDKIKPELVIDNTEKKKPKKPCPNCTCGLAQELENNQETKPATSSCGSCHLGDAFRCASCPHRGTPAFKPGERVVIDTTSSDL